MIETGIEPSGCNPRRVAAVLAGLERDCVDATPAEALRVLERLVLLAAWDMREDECDAMEPVRRRTHVSLALRAADVELHRDYVTAGDPTATGFTDEACDPTMKWVEGVLAATNSDYLRPLRENRARSRLSANPAGARAAAAHGRIAERERNAARVQVADPSFLPVAREWLKFADAMLGANTSYVLGPDVQRVPERGDATWSHGPERLRMAELTVALCAAVNAGPDLLGSLVFPLWRFQADATARTAVAVSGPWDRPSPCDGVARRVEHDPERDRAEEAATARAGGDPPFGGIVALTRDLVECVRDAVRRVEAFAPVAASSVGDASTLLAPSQTSQRRAAPDVETMPWKQAAPKCHKRSADALRKAARRAAEQPGGDRLLARMWTNRPNGKGSPRVADVLAYASLLLPPPSASRGACRRVRK